MISSNFWLRAFEFCKIYMVVVVFVLAGERFKSYSTLHVVSRESFVELLNAAGDGFTEQIISEFLLNYILPLSQNLLTILFIFVYAALFLFVLSIFIFTHDTAQQMAKKKIFVFFITAVICILRVYYSEPFFETADGGSWYYPFAIYTAITIVGIMLLAFFSNVQEYLRKNAGWTRYVTLPLVLGTISLLAAISEEYGELIFAIGLFAVVFADFILLVGSISFVAIESDLKSASAGKQYIKEKHAKASGSRQRKLELGRHIQQRNKVNFRVAFYLFFILITHLYLLLLLYFYKGWSREFFVNWMTEVLFFFTFCAAIRFASRSYEIIRAFLGDIYDKGKKQSYLDGKDRLLLAGRSLIEVAVLASVIKISYTLATEMNSFEQKLEPISFVSLLVQSAFTSIATMSFNISYPPSDLFFNQVIHMIQLLVSVSLITLSIASYLSYKEE